MQEVVNKACKKYFNMQKLDKIIIRNNAFWTDKIDYILYDVYLLKELSHSCLKKDPIPSIISPIPSIAVSKN